MVRIWGTERDGNEYLFVKLVDVVGGFVLGLNDERVLVKSLGCGHGEDEGAQGRMQVQMMVVWREKGLISLMTRVCFRYVRRGAK